MNIDCSWYHDIYMLYTYKQTHTHTRGERQPEYTQINNWFIPIPIPLELIHTARNEQHEQKND